MNTGDWDVAWDYEGDLTPLYSNGDWAIVVSIADSTKYDIVHAEEVEHLTGMNHYGSYTAHRLEKDGTCADCTAFIPEQIVTLFRMLTL